MPPLDLVEKRDDPFFRLVRLGLVVSHGQGVGVEVERQRAEFEGLSVKRPDAFAEHPVVVPETFERRLDEPLEHRAHYQTEVSVVATDAWEVEVRCLVQELDGWLLLLLLRSRSRSHCRCCGVVVVVVVWHPLKLRRAVQENGFDAGIHGFQGLRQLQCLVEDGFETLLRCLSSCYAE